MRTWRGEWRWRLVSGNQRIVADSAEGYVSRGNAVRAARRVFMAFWNADVDRP